jgi:hypothetical protein
LTIDNQAAEEIAPHMDAIEQAFGQGLCDVDLLAAIMPMLKLMVERFV